MAEKYSHCKTCLNRIVLAEHLPCSSCGWGPRWYSTFPNSYEYDPDAKPEPVEPEEEPLPTPEEVEAAAIEIAAPFGLAPIVADALEENPITEEEISAAAEDTDPWENLGEAEEEDLVTISDEGDLVLTDLEPEEEPVPQVHIDSDNYFYCKKCKGRHKYTSKKGKSHRKHKE